MRRETGYMALDYAREPGRLQMTRVTGGGGGKKRMARPREVIGCRVPGCGWCN